MMRPIAPGKKLTLCCKEITGSSAHRSLVSCAASHALLGFAIFVCAIVLITADFGTATGTEEQQMTEATIGIILASLLFVTAALGK